MAEEIGKDFVDGSQGCHQVAMIFLNRWFLKLGMHVHGVSREIDYYPGKFVNSSLDLISVCRLASMCS